MKTTQIVQSMSSPSPEADADSRFRILLETDAPYMIPGNIYASLNGVKGKLPICHTAMIPWTADFVAKVAGQGWDAERVMRVARDNARKVYGV
jgi:TatD DNase family protein